MNKDWDTMTVAQLAPAGGSQSFLLRTLQHMPGHVFMLELEGDAPSPRWLYVSPSLASLLSMEPLRYPVNADAQLDLIQSEDRARLQSLLLRDSEQTCDFREQINITVSGGVRALDVLFCVRRRGRSRLAYGYCLEISTAPGPPAVWRIWTSIFEQSAEGIVICDSDARILFVNPAFERVTGYQRGEVVGQTPRILNSGRQDADFYSRMWHALHTEGHWAGEIVNRRKSGETYDEWLSIRVVESSGRRSHFVAVFTEITDRKRAEERVEQLTNFDALTGLPNRTLLAYRLEQLLHNTARHHGKLALLFVDLDHFKTVNDSIGHGAGDLLLRAIADRLSECVRPADVVARLGGDEFAIGLPDVGGRAAAAELAEKVLAQVSEPLMLSGQQLSMSASIGVCIYPDDAVSASDMIRNADSALYEAKRSGRNVYHFYTPEISDQARRALATENALRHALQRQEFELLYQPQIDLDSGDILAVEALIRWHRPGAGLVAPDEFIPVAEERGLIGAIGDWVLDAALRQVVAWNAAGLPPFALAINLSATQFHQPAFADRLIEVLRASGIAPERIKLEITEGIIVKDANATIDILRSLHAFGVQLAIDDFGTGYSSLSYLRRFPINEIKVDKSFVHDMLDDRGSAGIVGGIIGLAESLDLLVVAEGVETTEQLASLRRLKCRAAQGYLFARPLTAQDLETFIAGWLQRCAALLGAP